MEYCREKVERIYCPFAQHPDVELDLFYVDEGPGNDILKSFNCDVLDKNRCLDSGEPCRVVGFIGEDISEII
jgi:hypothetical protein